MVIPVISVMVSFLTISLTLGILFSTVVRQVVVAKLVILGISLLTTNFSTKSSSSSLVMLGILFSTLFILALRAVLLAKLVISAI